MSLRRWMVMMTAAMQGAGAGGYEYTNAEAQAYVAAMPSEPDDTRKQLIDEFFTAIKAGAVSGSNLLTKLDLLYLLAAHDQDAARINAIDPGPYDATITNSPTFTADTGFTFDGATSYLETNFNPSTAGGNFGLDSACWGFWSLTAGTQANGSGITAGGDSITLNPRTGTNVFRNFVNAIAASDIANADGVGLFIANRSSSTIVEGYKNGVDQNPNDRSSVAIPNGTLKIGYQGAGFHAFQCASAVAGASLTADEHLDLYNALDTYMTGVGL